MSGTQEEVRVVHPPHGGKIPLTVLAPEAPSTRTPLVLVPGVGGPRDTYHHQMQAFGADRMVVATNLNAVSAPRVGPIGSAAQDVLCVLDELGIARCDLMGASFGSTIVARVAALAPERVRRLLWIAPPVVRHGPWRRSFGPGWLVGGALLKYAPPSQRGPVARFVASRRMYTVEPDLDEIELERLAGRISDTQFRPFFSRLAALHSWDWRRFDAPHPHPLLVVQGAQEHAMTPPDMVRAWERASGRPVAVVPGYHMPYLSYPEPFNAVVREFLDAPDYS